ncbi:MAG: hypothetical protein WC668_03870 [Patescibacteria group bacterium]|jgi:hypothetical protein
MKQRKRCKPCSAGRHTDCTGQSAHQDGRECSCCGLLTAEARTDKEKRAKAEKAQARHERDYNENADAFYILIRQKRLALGVEDPVEFLGCLPTTEAEIRAWAREVGMTVKWFKFFLDEYRQDHAGLKIMSVLFDPRS